MFTQGSVLFDKHDKSADADSASKQGMQYGAQVGSLFGPVGTAIGMAAGGIIGAARGNGARDRARRKATNQSYQFAEDVFKYARKTRRQVQTEYERSMSLLDARIAATGASMNENRRIQRGKLAMQRDRALETLEAEYDAYRQGPNYEWFRRDYERVSGGRVGHTGSAKNNEVVYSFSAAGESYGSGPRNKAYNSKQLSMLKSWKSKAGGRERSPGDNARIEIMSKYGEMIKPSMKWYEKRVFGNAQDRADYNEYIEGRIKQANKYYDAEMASLQVKEKIWAEQKKKADSRGK